MEILQTLSAPIITVFTFGIIECFKRSTTGKYSEHYVTLAFCIGVVLGLAGYLTINDYLPASNWLEACVSGTTSGGAGVGLYEGLKHVIAGRGGRGNETHNLMLTLLKTTTETAQDKLLVPITGYVLAGVLFIVNVLPSKYKQIREFFNIYPRTYLI